MFFTPKILERERQNFSLWLPVFFAFGVAFYFSFSANFLEKFPFFLALFYVAIFLFIFNRSLIILACAAFLVGSFYAPTLVICDLDTLATLPRNELLAGFGEVVKYGFIADERILELLETDLEAATDVNSSTFGEIVRRCIAIKARVVGEDFKEAGLREILNYGHTLGHAIELAERYQWRHGAAISVGMMFVAELSRLAGRLGDDVVERQRTILQSLGLPTTYEAPKWNALLATMQRDKKSRAGNLRFVVLDGVAKPTIMTAPAPELLFAAYQEICN